MFVAVIIYIYKFPKFTVVTSSLSVTAAVVIKFSFVSTAVVIKFTPVTTTTFQVHLIVDL